MVSGPLARSCPPIPAVKFERATSPEWPSTEYHRFVLTYSSSSARRSRQIRRLLAGAVRAARVRPPTLLRAFWWDGHRNCGDMLTPWLLPRYGFVPVLRPPELADLVGVGSILEMVPENYTGGIWGSGLMVEERRSFPSARFLAVRGALTAHLLGVGSDVPLGDPGLLMARHVPRAEHHGKIVVMPHGHHVHDPRFARLLAQTPELVRVVRHDEHPVEVARGISGAALVVTSSLHGLVLADSYGIPVVWVTTEIPLGGGDFKFRDHESVVRPSAPRHLRLTDATTLDDLRAAASEVPRDRVAELGDGLEAGLRGILTT